MAEIAYGIAGTILEKLGSTAYSEIILAWDMDKDLKKLQDKTLMLRSLLKDAEKKQKTNERLRMWLIRLKDLFNDALDVIDDFDCEMLRRQVAKEYHSLARKVRCFFSRKNPNAFRFHIAHNVKQVLERFDEMAGDMAQFQLISTNLSVDEELESSGSVYRDRMTYSFVKVSDVIGRDIDKAQIVAMLRCQSGGPIGDDNQSVIAIVGIGGLGKTTLAKLVYNDGKVGEAFDLRLWVCVSFDFDFARLAREILEAGVGNLYGDLSKMSIDQLQTSLRRSLEGKKFLLVLDDVWNEGREKWLELREFLSLGTEGSKVLVTTRSTSVSSIMTRTPPHILKGLAKEDSLSLFLKYAFGDERRVEQYPRLANIGKEIAKKCRGVPLALKTLGSLLYSKPEIEWIRVRDNEIWELERDDGRIIPALQLSYNAMASSLKQCFAFCSTFPDDTQMSYIELISIWMALEALQSNNGKMELEDIAELQLEELSARSFIQQVNIQEYDEENSILGVTREYNMHDLIHDLARSVTYSECSIVKSGAEVVCDTVRNLRIFLNPNSLPIIKKLKRLRSIHIVEPSGNQITKSLLGECITQLRNLRILDLNDCDFTVLPSSIGSLKHMRFLNLSNNTMITKLPDSICDLQSLQTMLLHWCTSLKELPKSIQKLVSLRTLSVTTTQIYFAENGIGCLKSLRTLMILDCKRLRSLPRDMKYCTTLRTLAINGCDKLDFESEFDEPITELSLQTLFIVDLPRAKALPQWLKGASRTLKSLVVTKCGGLVRLPEWMPNLVSLQTLTIHHCRELVALPDGIQHLAALEHVVFSECEQLELGTTNGNVAPLSLQRARISNLLQLTALPLWLQGATNTLKLLRIQGCPKLTKLPEWLQDFSSLTKLQIKKCTKLVALPKGMPRLTSLRDLEIESCKNLEIANESNEVTKLCLQRFHVNKLPGTTRLPDWLQGAAYTLQDLHIEIVLIWLLYQNGCLISLHSESFSSRIVRK